MPPNQAIHTDDSPSSPCCPSLKPIVLVLENILRLREFLGQHDGSVNLEKHRSYQHRRQ